MTDASLAASAPLRRDPQFVRYWLARVDRRRLMIMADLISAAVIGSVPLGAALHGLTTTHVLAAAALAATVFVFFDAANFGALPTLVRPRRLVVGEQRRLGGRYGGGDPGAGWSRGSLRARRAHIGTRRGHGLVSGLGLTAARSSARCPIPLAAAAGSGDGRALASSSARGASARWPLRRHCRPWPGTSPRLESRCSPYQLEGGDLTARVVPTGPPEIREVGTALNRLAERIRELLQSDRETVADLSHRLRTPVTALRLDAEALRDPEEAERLSGDVDELQRAVDRIIRAARHRRARVCGRRATPRRSSGTERPSGECWPKIRRDASPSGWTPCTR